MSLIKDHLYVHKFNNEKKSKLVLSIGYGQCLPLKEPYDMNNFIWGPPFQIRTESDYYDLGTLTGNISKCIHYCLYADQVCIRDGDGRYYSAIDLTPMNRPISQEYSMKFDTGITDFSVESLSLAKQKALRAQVLRHEIIKS